MLFVNMSPLLWDIIIITMMIFGLVTGLFIGGRALIFISCGNLLAIGLMLVFKPLLINNFKNMVAPWFTNLNPNFLSFRNLLIDNVSFIMYAIIWIGSINFLFWTIYLTLYFTILKKHKVEHKGINATMGALINFIRMSIIGGLLIVAMGTNVFGNKILSYDTIKNEIPNQSITYKMFSDFDANVAFFNIRTKDINQVISIYQTGEVFKATDMALIDATNYKQCFIVVKNLRTVVTLQADENLKIDNALKTMEITGDVDGQKIIIENAINNFLINRFLDTNFMLITFNAFSHIINLYPETTNNFIESLSSVPKLDTNDAKYKPRYTILKPLVHKFIAAINDMNAKMEIIVALEGLYDPL